MTITWCPESSKLFWLCTRHNRLSSHNYAQQTEAGIPTNLPLWSRRPNQRACSTMMSPSQNYKRRCVGCQRSPDKINSTAASRCRRRQLHSSLERLILCSLPTARRRRTAFLTVVAVLSPKPHPTLLRWSSGKVSVCLESSRPGFYLCPCLGAFPRLKHISELNSDTPMIALLNTWRYRVGTGTCLPGVSISRLGDIKFDLQLLSTCGCTHHCLRRHIPAQHLNVAGTSSNPPPPPPSLS